MAAAEKRRIETGEQTESIQGVVFFFFFIC